MKKKFIKFFTIIVFVYSFSSCLQEESKLSKEELINHLKQRSDNYIFYDSNSKESRLDMPEPISFNSIEELDIFLKNMENLTIEAFSMSDEIMHSPPDGGGTNDLIYYKNTFYLGGFWVYMNVGFNVDMLNCQGSNLNSWLSGFTLGVSYDHTGGTLTTLDYPNNRISYHVYGVMHYNIIVEGLGVAFSENRFFVGKYLCN